MPVGILNKTLYINGVPVTTEEFRDGLLGRNLPPPIPNEIQEGNFQSFYQDIGKLFSLPNPLVPEAVQIDEDALQDGGEDRRLINLSQNKYQDSDSVIEYSTIDLIINPNSVVNGNYTIQNFGLIEGSGGIGIQNPFTAINAPRTTDFDSKLANIASERLEFALNEKVTQSIINETIDKVNLDPLSLLQGNELIQRNYDITTPANIIGKGVELIGKITGTQLPVSTIPKGAIGWQEYNQARANSGKLANSIRNVLTKLGVTTELNLTTEKRMDELLKRTGGGQKNALFSSIQLNKYIPNYSSPRLFGILGDRAPNSRYYIGSENSTNRGYGVTRQFKAEDFLEDEGAGLVRPPENFTWGTQNVGFAEQTILAKTKYLADEFSETDVFIDQTKKFFKDKLTDKVVSRGNAITDNSGEFARVWLKSSDGTQREQLEKGYSYQNAIRKSGLFVKDSEKPGFSVDSGKASLSVLQSNGTVKSYPYLEESFTTYKKYMLSLENLAWTDKLADLPIQEIGPGDLVSGNKGRIMWFAPYDLSFDETTTANWTDTQFLGRGEPLYTYNNTSRSGTFKFKILVDHPRIVNEYRGRQNNELEKFFAGITSPSEFLSIIQRNTKLDGGTKKELEKKLNSIVRQSKASLNTKTEKFSTYFKDGSSAFDSSYNPDGLNDKYIDFTNNSGSIYDIINNEDYKINIDLVGYQSKSGEDFKVYPQIDLGKDRGDKLKTDIESKIKGKKGDINVTSKSINSAAGNEGANPNSEVAIKDRRVDVTITYFPKGDDSEDADPQSALNELLQRDLDIVSELFINETTYFDIIAEDYPNYFDNISSKLTYFHPGFHSNTPEGLNTRLNFLQQCMRQGSSVYNSNDKIKPDNLSFGRPPVLILRIGDFIHTKIIAKSLSINYTNGSNIQWDLNPEGIGVQPMMAEVSMSIEIIGGQSLQGPINRLQNAMSYNFYANSEMYDPRADSIRLNGAGGEIVDGIKLSEIRGGEFSKSLTKELKTELPIDQEATRLKAEANEQEANKERGFIDINIGDTEIKVISKKGDTPTVPSLLIDGSGENKIKINIKDGDDKELESEENDKEENTYVIKKFLKIDDLDIDKITSKLDKQMNKVNSLITSYEANKNKWSKNKNKRKQKQIQEEEEELTELVNKYVSKITITSSFTRDERTTKRKVVTYQWDYKKESNTYISDGWKININ